VKELAILGQIALLLLECPALAVIHVGLISKPLWSRAEEEQTQLAGFRLARGPEWLVLHQLPRLSVLRSNVKWWNSTERVFRLGQI